MVCYLYLNIIFLKNKNCSNTKIFNWNDLQDFIHKISFSMLKNWRKNVVQIVLFFFYLKIQPLPSKKGLCCFLAFPLVFEIILGITTSQNKYSEMPGESKVLYK